MERIYILLSEEKLLSSWQAACQALGLECAAAVAGENRKMTYRQLCAAGQTISFCPTRAIPLRNLQKHGRSGQNATV